MNLRGYRRSDGRVGIRNKVLILPTCACSSETCMKVAARCNFVYKSEWMFPD